MLSAAACICISLGILQIYFRLTRVMICCVGLFGCVVNTCVDMLCGTLGVSLTRVLICCVGLFGFVNTCVDMLCGIGWVCR